MIILSLELHLEGRGLAGTDLASLSWLRAAPHLTVLSLGRTVFTSSPRVRLTGSPDYNLLISDLSPADGGLYLCQLNTVEGLGRRVMLEVKEREGRVRALQEERLTTRILGPAVLRLEVGRRLRLECLVTHQDPLQRPAFFTW